MSFEKEPKMLSKSNEVLWVCLIVIKYYKYTWTLYVICDRVIQVRWVLKTL